MLFVAEAVVILLINNIHKTEKSRTHMQQKQVEQNPIKKLKQKRKLCTSELTLNDELFSSFFGGAPTIHIPVS